MKSLIFAAVVASTGVSIGASDVAPIPATGTMYFVFDMAAEAKVDGIIFARFVPDAKSLSGFAAVTSGPYPGPVRFVSFEPADEVLKATVGKSEANRLLHGTEPVVGVRVEIVVANYKSEVECDSRAYYGTLLSVKARGVSLGADPAKEPHGC